MSLGLDMKWVGVAKFFDPTISVDFEGFMEILVNPTASVDFEGIVETLVDLVVSIYQCQSCELRF